MNDAIFFGGFIVCVPMGILLAILFPRIHKAVFFCLVLGTTNTGGLFGLPLDINFLSREWYRGTTRGIEVSYLDLLAVVLFFSTLVVRKREGRPMFFWPTSLGWMPRLGRGLVPRGLVPRGLVPRGLVLQRSGATKQATDLKDPQP